MLKWGEEIFKPTIWNDSLHQDINDDDVRILKFATSENLVVKSTMCPHRNAWTLRRLKTRLITY